MKIPHLLLSSPGTRQLLTCSASCGKSRYSCGQSFTTPFRIAIVAFLYLVLEHHQAFSGTSHGVQAEDWSADDTVKPHKSKLERMKEDAAAAARCLHGP